MRFVTAVVLPLAMIAAPPAFAKGCVRGAAAGAVGGHLIGKGHAVLGAVAGCAVAHHRYARQAKART